MMSTPSPPECEEVSPGQELLHMLWGGDHAPLADSDVPILQILMPEEMYEEDAQDEEDTEASEVPVKVLLKNSFIEVVDPQCRKGMQRSMSDSCLHYSSYAEYTTDVLVIQKHTEKMEDFSDDSTAISSDVGGECAIRKDTCWSDDEGAMEAMLAQPYMPGYQYVDEDGGVWWMPMAFDPFTGAVMLPDGSVMEVDATWGEWADQSAFEGGEAELFEGEEWRTTVMLRNMPNNYTRDMLLELVNSMGFDKCYDFAYLPVDFKSQAGLGYGFINFASSEQAQLCFERFEGFCDWEVPSEKRCTVTWGSPYQGLEAHIERYQNSPVMHHTIPDEWKPVLLQDGVRIPFPAPTKPIKTPKIRQQPNAE